MIKQIMIAAIILTASVFAQTDKLVITENDYAIINYSKQIDVDEAIKKDILFDGSRRKIVQLTLNDGKSLGSHTVAMPFMVYCVAGDGELIIGKNEKSIELNSGTMVTVEANVQHDVIAQPDISIIVIRFLNDNMID